MALRGGGIRCSRIRGVGYDTVLVQALIKGNFRNMIMFRAP